MQYNDKKLVEDALTSLTVRSPENSWFTPGYLILYVGTKLSVTGDVVLVERCLDQLFNEGKAERTNSKYFNEPLNWQTHAYRPIL